MLIKALSQDTVRLLGSPLVVTSPVSLVKELVENSIDARATSVEILISLNTIDRIEVRDNGEGIYHDDFDTLGRRGHTSKLRTYQDLRAVGGKSYGFRGEALASANALGTVTVTTRTSQDPVAATLHLIPGDGGVAKQLSASAPLGTTVSVTALFGRLPVREQLALREGPKTIIKIKELLPSYALARPNLRISFKVLKMDKMGWTYSPRPQAGVKEATLQIFGSGVVSRCLMETHSMPTESSSNEDSDTPGILTLQAFLPKPDADVSQLCRGAHISVDSRPVNPTRGTMRKLVSAFKSRLSAASGASDHLMPLKNPFIQLSILCPVGWYDPNVEPSKDDIIFSDESKVLDAFQSLCTKVYGEEQLQEPSNKMDNPSTSMHVGLDGTIAPGMTPDSSGTKSPIHIQAPAGQLKHTESSVKCSNQSKTTLNTPPQSSSPPRHLKHYLHDSQMAANTIDASFEPMNEVEKIDCSSIARPSGMCTVQSNVESHQVPGMWRVDMSTSLEMSSDEEDELPPDTSRGSGMSHVDGIEEESANSKEALNPWTIAKMAVSDNASESTGLRMVPPVAGYEVTASTVVEEHGMNTGLPILRHPVGPPGDLDIPLARRQQRQVQVGVPGGPYRSPLVGSQSHSCTREPRMPLALNVLQTPPPSFGDERHHSHSRTGNTGLGADLPQSSDGYIQTSLSFGEPSVSEKKSKKKLPDLRSTEHEKAVSRPMKGKFTSYSSKVASNQRRRNAAQRTDADEFQNGKVNVSTRHDHSEDFDLRRHLRPATPFDINFPGIVSDGGPAIGSGSMSDLGSVGLAAKSPRSSSIRNRRSLSQIEPSFRKRSKSVKTDMLPLERTPEEQDTCKLVYTMNINKQAFTETCNEEDLTLNANPNSELPKWSLDMIRGGNEVAWLDFRIKSLWSEWTRTSLGTKMGLDINLMSACQGVFS